MRGTKNGKTKERRYCKEHPVDRGGLSDITLRGETKLACQGERSEKNAFSPAVLSQQWSNHSDNLGSCVEDGSRFSAGMTSWPDPSFIHE